MPLLSRLTRPPCPRNGRTSTGSGTSSQTLSRLGWLPLTPGSLRSSSRIVRMVLRTRPTCPSDRERDNRCPAIGVEEYRPQSSAANVGDSSTPTRRLRATFPATTCALSVDRRFRRPSTSAVRCAIMSRLTVSHRPSSHRGAISINRKRFQSANARKSSSRTLFHPPSTPLSLRHCTFFKNQNAHLLWHISIALPFFIFDCHNNLILSHDTRFVLLRPDQE